MILVLSWDRENMSTSPRTASSSCSGPLHARQYKCFRYHGFGVIPGHMHLIHMRHLYHAVQEVRQATRMPTLQRRAAHLFRCVLGLWVEARRVAVHLLGEPIADVRHLLRRQLVQIYSKIRSWRIINKMMVLLSGADQHSQCPGVVLNFQHGTAVTNIFLINYSLFIKSQLETPSPRWTTHPLQIRHC